MQAQAGASQEGLPSSFKPWCKGQPGLLSLQDHGPRTQNTLSQLKETHE